jgi:hypothetical protein
VLNCLQNPEIPGNHKDEKKMKTLTKKDEHVGKTVVFLPPSKHYSKEVAEKVWTKEYLDKIAETKADSYEYEWLCYDNLDSEDTNLTSKNIPVGTLVDIALHDDLRDRRGY